jgi:hypothetical protein
LIVFSFFCITSFEILKAFSVGEPFSVICLSSSCSVFSSVCSVCLNLQRYPFLHRRGYFQFCTITWNTYCAPHFTTQSSNAHSIFSMHVKKISLGKTYKLQWE